jgi:serine/threonine-protein kinase
VAADSEAIIEHLQSAHTDERRFQIDFSLRVLRAGDEAEHRAFEPTSDFYETECDPAAPPVPEGGSLEGEDGYECTSDGDCHLIVLDQDECRLFEMWRANIDASDAFYGGCQAIWEVDRVYPDDGRGLHCSSADAAGLPIAPLLFTADEVAAGTVPHALRFALPNTLIRNGRFVAPGSHATRSASGGANSPPYAARLRLRAGTDLAGLGDAARVIAEALQRYGMYLADGGNITFMGQDERDSDATWDDVGLGPHDLKDLQWSDFEVVDSGPAIEWTGDCERDPVTE